MVKKHRSWHLEVRLEFAEVAVSMGDFNGHGHNCYRRQCYETHQLSAFLALCESSVPYL